MLADAVRAAESGNDAAARELLAIADSLGGSQLPAEVAAARIAIEDAAEARRRPPPTPWARVRAELETTAATSDPGPSTDAGPYREAATADPRTRLRAALLRSDEDPATCFELAELAEAVGNVSAARLALRRFAELAGGHRRVGAVHSAERLARLLVSRPLCRGNREAIDLLRAAREDDPGLGSAFLAELLIVDDQREEALEVIDAALASAPDHPDATRLRALAATARLSFWDAFGPRRG